jgi:UDP-N-acetylglucosamine 4-epimerase
MKSLIGKRVLVTGGAGFIGSNLCDHLLELGNQVTCLDNLSTGKYANIEHLTAQEHFSFFKGDIRDFNTCKAAVEGKEIVFHQAALGSVPRSIENPLMTHAVNNTGFLNMLEAARLHQVNRFIYAASSSTYGDSEVLPKQEDTIGKPLSPYAVTKQTNELYAHVYGNLYGIKIIGLRYFNVFGRRQDPNGAYAAAIPRFMLQLLSGEPPVIHGDGLQSRDFTYIKNVLQINVLAAQVENPKALNQVYNVAFGKRTTLLDLLNAIQGTLAKHAPHVESIKAVFGAERKGDVRHSHADISKARTLLGYDPNYDLKTGLEEAADWYFSQLKSLINLKS